MNEKIKTSLYATSAIVGSKLVKYAPVLSSKVPFLKEVPDTTIKFSSGLVLCATGYFMKGELGKNILAGGIGAVVNSIFDAVGL